MFFFHIQALVRIHLHADILPQFTSLAQYNALSLFFSWFALANLWLSFSIIIDLLPGQGVVLISVVTVSLAPPASFSLTETE